MASVDVTATMKVTRNEVGLQEARHLVAEGWTPVEPETRPTDGGWDVLFLLIDHHLREKRILIATVEMVLAR